MKEVVAFSPEAKEHTINLNGKDLPLVVADHSVVYLPMKGADPIVCLNAADAWDTRKGINKTLESFTSDEMKELCNVDNELNDNLIELIKRECKNKEIISYRNGNSEEIFKTDGWEKKIIYNFIESIPSVGAGAGEGTMCVTKGRENEILVTPENVSKVKIFIKTMLELCQVAIIKANVKTDAPAITSSDIDKAWNIAVNKGFKDQRKRGYYIFQIPGTYINTQPFGGFNFSGGRDDIYKTSDKFKAYLNSIFSSFNRHTHIFANEVSNSGMDWAKPSNCDAIAGNLGSLIHLDSKTSEIDDLVKHIKGFPNTNIFAGDTNLTVGKGNILSRKEIYKELPGNTISREEFSKKLPGYLIVMSRTKIQKSRAGGPFMNSQIYKSVPTIPPPEHDGMIIIVKIDSPIMKQIDKSELLKMTRDNFDVFGGGLVNLPNLRLDEYQRLEQQQLENGMKRISPGEVSLDSVTKERKASRAFFPKEKSTLRTRTAELKTKKGKGKKKKKKGKRSSKL